jgi:ligand-binding sensor domain-containing protein/signal transduction histidine kinase
VSCAAWAAAAAFAGACLAGELRFETLASEKGLSENSVKAIVEDRQGFLWFGTENGLDRFDGLEFTVFRAGSDPTRELVEDHVNALLSARDGTLWIGTFGGGLSHYDPRDGVFRTRLHDPADPASLAGNDVSALYEDPAGRVYVGSRGGGVDRIAAKDGALVHIVFPADAGVGVDQPSAIVGDGADGAWVATLGAGLFHVDAEGKAQRVVVPPDVGHDLTALLRDANGRLWVGTRRSGVLRVPEEGKPGARYTHDDAQPQSLAHDTINRIVQDAAGRIWIATARGLDQALPDGSFVHHQHDPADPATLPYNDVFAVLQDAQGALWVGTGGGGVARHAPPGREFALSEHDPADPHGASAGGVWSVLEAGDGRVWIGTLDGGLQVAERAGARFRAYRDARGGFPLGDDDVRGLAEGEGGTLWVATRRGLAHLDPRTGAVRRYTHDPARADSLAHDYVRPLVRDAQGTLWVGTYGGGLDRLAAGADTFVHYRHAADDAASLSDDRVYSLLADADGTLWVGTHGGGLDRLDVTTGRFTRYRHDPRDPRSLGNDRVLAVQRDRHGTLWIGTGSGLDRFDAATSGFVHEEGIRGDVVYGIAEDAAGRLWLSTNEGLARFEPQHGRVRRYPMWELWGNSEFNGGAWHRGRSGRLYFGGVSGLVAVDPAAPATQRREAQPVLTEFLLFNRPVAPATVQAGSPLPRPIAYADRVVLSHEDDVFGFAFAAPHATHPERRLYAYRLDGFDDRWIETRAHRRDATYTAVPAGDYLFRVRLSDADGAWLPDEARIGVTVLPSPWRSPAAYALYALVVLALLAWWLTLRHRRARARLLAQQRLRESEERLSLALWGSGDILLDWDLEAGTMRRVGGSVDDQRPMVAYGVVDVDALAMLMHRDDFPAVRAAHHAHFAGETEYLEVTYRERNAEHTWPWKLVRARIVARDAVGRPRRLTGMQQDITRMKAVESELRELNEALDTRVQQRTAELQARQHELEAANERLSGMLEELQRTQGELVEAEKMASLGRLVAGVAHEVNTPLGVGVTAVSFLRSQVAAVKTALRRLVGNEEADRLVAPIEQAGEMTEGNLQRAAALVRTFKQVAVDQANPDVRRFKLRDYLESSLQSLRPRLRSTGHALDLRCDASIEMTGRPDALYQIVVNLVMNSLMHGFPEGHAGRISLDAEAVDGQIRLVYADEGVGMSPEVAARVFEPFFTTRRHAGGTGLGMHIVYNLVTQALGGRITLATAPGQGVRFTIVFPQVPVKA